MAGNILTPTLLWKNFVIDGKVDGQVIEEKTQKGIVYTHYYLDGKVVEDGRVKIYGVMLRQKDVSMGPAILLVRDFNDGEDLSFAQALVKKGYTVFTVDLAGQRDGVNRYTEYPQSLEYANLEKSQYLQTEIEKDISKSCWYEWACVLKYTLSFMREEFFIKSIGVIGVSHSATPLWQVVGTEKDLECAVFISNVGWQGYKGINKFSGEVEPEFNDNQLKFIAGVEPQSYAAHINCPTLVLCPTNSVNFDCDRAYDTVSRITEKVFKGVDYSVNTVNAVSFKQYQNMLAFLDIFLLKNSSQPNLPEWPDIKAEIQDGKLNICVLPYGNDIENVQAFVSEEIYCPELRHYESVNLTFVDKDKEYHFVYSPYSESGIITLFGRVTYKNGISLCSNIICKKFTSKEVLPSYKSRILYSSCGEAKNKHFVCVKENGAYPCGVAIKDEYSVKTVAGPMKIDGISSKYGLLSLKINAQKDKPQDDAILMLDAYIKNGGFLTVKLICDYYKNRVEYSSTIKIVNGDLWQNIKIEQNQFKSSLGMMLKSYNNVEAIEISADQEEFAINNVLWV